MTGPLLSDEMAGLESEFQGQLLANAGFLYPYRYPAFACTIWAANVLGGRYGAALVAVPELAHADVRFLSVRPGDTPPAEGERLPFQGGVLTVRWWGQIDPLSGEAIAACSWEF